MTAQEQLGREGAGAVRAGERSLPAVSSQVSVEAGSREKRHRAKVARITEVTCCFQAIHALIGDFKFHDLGYTAVLESNMTVYGSRF